MDRFASVCVAGLTFDCLSGRTRSLLLGRRVQVRKLVKNEWLIGLVAACVHRQVHVLQGHERIRARAWP